MTLKSCICPQKGCVVVGSGPEARVHAGRRIGLALVRQRGRSRVQLRMRKHFLQMKTKTVENTEGRRITQMLSLSDLPLYSRIIGFFMAVTGGGRRAQLRDRGQLDAAPDMRRRPPRQARARARRRG